MRMHLSRVLSVAALAATLVVPSGASAAGIGGFSARPAHFDAAVPATRAYFIRRVARGGSFADQILITNSDSGPARLRVYPVDGLTGVTSGAVYGNRGARLTRAGRWLVPAVSMVTVPAHGQVSVPFRVRVPAGAAVGDHLAGLAVENVRSHRSGGRFSITEVLRDVVGVEVQVPGSSHFRVRPTALALRALPGTRIPSVVVGLSNYGTRLCKPSLTVTLLGADLRGQVTRQLDTVLPGDTIPYPFPWPRPLNGGSYRAVARTSGCGTPVSLSRAVSLPGSLTGTSADPQTIAAAAVSRPRNSGSKWWSIPLVGLAGIGLGVAAALKLMRRPPASPRGPSAS